MLALNSAGERVFHRWALEHDAGHWLTAGLLDGIMWALVQVILLCR